MRFYLFLTILFCLLIEDCLSEVCSGGIFTGQYEKYAWMLYIIIRIAFWFGVAWIMHRKKIYIAL